MKNISADDGPLRFYGERVSVSSVVGDRGLISLVLCLSQDGPWRISCYQRAM